MKKFWIAILACLSFVCLAFAAGCGGPKLAFNEGYMEEVELGEPIMLDEYIDPTLTDDYTAVLTYDETGMERDLKMLGQWTTEQPGTYTLTYTVNSGEYKGTISTKINVVVPKARWTYSRPTLVYRAGDTMLFNALKRELNIFVDSYYPEYVFFVKSVMFDGTRVDLTEQTSYTFTCAGDHIVTFGVRTQDGQEMTSDLKISVRPQQVLAPGAEEWMEENNITTHDYTYVSPTGEVVLEAGSYKSYTGGVFARDNVSYLAFNGEAGYGVGTYMMVDFTGKNLPQIAFFCDEVTPSLVDGKNGIYISNGTTMNSGNVFSEYDSHRLTVFGPQKLKSGKVDNPDRMWNTGAPGAACPMSYVALDENCQYKYIVGFSSVSATHVTLDIILINMTTNERVFVCKQKMTGYSSGNDTNIALNLPEDYFKGSIVLYGRFGVETRLDKVYLPFTDVQDIYELDVAAEFRTDYKKTYALGATANIFDYIDAPVVAYNFTVTDPDGEVVAVDKNGSFTYEKSGTYRMLYEPIVSGVRPSSITVRVVLDPAKELAADYLETEGIFTAEMVKNTRWTTNSTTAKFIKEGSVSVKYDSLSPTKDYGLIVGLSREYMNYLFLADGVDGITFDVYSEKALTYQLFSPNTTYTIVKDYTGTIAENTWTTLTLPRSLFMANAACYQSGATYMLAISFNSEEGIAANQALYIDNIKLIQKGSAPELSAEAQAWLNANNATAYGYQSIGGDGSVTLNAGYYTGGYKTNFESDQLSYLAFNGATGTNGYGGQSYVVVDFTGKNMPQVAFFCDKVTPSLMDGANGIYISNGFTLNDGAVFSPHDSHRLTVFGPQKVSFAEVDNRGRMWSLGSPESACPMSYVALQDDCQYRYAVGFSEVATGYVKINILLINLTTKQKVFECNQKLTTYVGDDGNVNLNLTDYFKGSIVLYGRYGVETKWDKVYSVYENVSDINAIDKMAEALV